MAANAADENLGNGSFNPFRHRIVKRWSRTESFCAATTTGSMVNKQKLVEEAAGQGFNAVARALSSASRGEILERNQGRLIKRVK
jgi:hypothetical protein